MTAVEDAVVMSINRHRLTSVSMLNYAGLRADLAVCCVLILRIHCTLVTVRAQILASVTWAL
jgi:hypothetical protein